MRPAAAGLPERLDEGPHVQVECEVFRRSCRAERRPVGAAAVQPDDHERNIPEGADDRLQPGPGRLADERLAQDDDVRIRLVDSARRRLAVPCPRDDADAPGLLEPACERMQQARMGDAEDDAQGAGAPRRDPGRRLGQRPLRLLTE